MDVRSVVTAFSDSPDLRETLTILLERSCALEFLAPSTALSLDWRPPDVAVVATSTALPLLHTLTSRWPLLPIVAVELPRHERLRGAPGVPASVHAVPLDPQAIRAAVVDRLVAPADAALRAAVRRVAEALRGELHYSFSALCSLTALHARGAGPDAYSVLGAVISEQCHVLTDSFEHLQAFLARPGTGEVSTDFVVEVCRHLERSDGVERGIFCERSDDALSLPPAGPVSLAPLVAAFVRAHVRRRADSPVVHLSLSWDGLRVSYVPRPGSASASVSWPLLLGELALRRCSWELHLGRSANEEAIVLLPAAPGGSPGVGYG